MLNPTSDGGRSGRIDAHQMADCQFTGYFLKAVLRKRPYIKTEWCIFVIENAVHSEPQVTKRWRFWAAIPELDGRYPRVVTLED
mgnify:FL=1